MTAMIDRILDCSYGGELQRNARIMMSVKRNLYNDVSKEELV